MQKIAFFQTLVIMEFCQNTNFFENYFLDDYLFSFFQ